MSNSPAPRSRWHLAFALLVIIFGAAWIYAAHQAALEHRIIPANGKHNAMSPLAGYTAGVLFVAWGVAYIIRWIQLVRRPPDE